MMDIAPYFTRQCVVADATYYMYSGGAHSVSFQVMTGDRPQTDDRVLVSTSRNQTTRGKTIRVMPWFCLSRNAFDYTLLITCPAYCNAKVNLPWELANSSGSPKLGTCKYHGVQVLKLIYHIQDQ